MIKLLKKFLNNYDYINEYYNFLVNKTKKLEYVGITNEWLIDNFYLLVEHKTSILTNKKIIKKSAKELDNIYLCLKSIIAKNNYNIDYKILINELRKYQKETKTTFTYKEIKTIRTALVFVYTEKLKSLCIDEYNKLLESEKITKIIKDKSIETIELDDFHLDSYSDNNKNYFIFELNNQLKELGSKSNIIFKELNETLENQQISLKDLINEEYQKKMDNDILISNIFNDLKEFFEIYDEDLFEKISKVEKLLLSDEVYKKMTDESKELYRDQLLHLAKSKHQDELTFLEKLMEKKKNDSSYHIGFDLFKKDNKGKNVIFYLITIVFVTILISFLISKYFIKCRILGFLILLIPVSQLFSQLFNQFLIKVVPTKILPKLDYSKGIPEESKTMVVIPTIVASKDKAKKMLDTLETYYLINKSDNLYFTLLGDIKSSNNLVEKFSKIVETNYKKILELTAENQNLEQLRETLLPKLMNGEIDLENVEI